MKGSVLFPLFAAALTPFLIFTLIIAATALGWVAWQPPVLWSRSVGAGSVTAVSSDSSGVVTQGYSLGEGSGSLFLDKFDPNGDPVWTRTMGDTNYDGFTNTITHMSLGPDGIYLSGENFSTGSREGVFLKYDLTGNKIWERDFAVGGVDAISTLFGTVYVTGVSPPLTNQSYTGSVSWIREYDSSGNVAWTSEFSNDSDVHAQVYASASGVFVTYSAINRTSNVGPLLMKYSLSGSKLWTLIAPTGGDILGDSTGVYLAGLSLYKYDFDGNEVWMTQINPPDRSQAIETSAAIDASGIYASVWTSRYNSYLLKYDLSGGQIWSLELPAPAQDLSTANTAYRVSAGLGPPYVAGSTHSSGQLSALLEEVTPYASLVFFNLNPPWSFMLLGGLIGGSAISLIIFRRLRRQKGKPPRVGLPQRSLPTND